MNLLDHIKKLAACEPADLPFISLYLSLQRFLFEWVGNLCILQT